MYWLVETHRPMRSGERYFQLSKYTLLNWQHDMSNSSVDRKVTDSLSRWPNSLSRWPTVWAGDRAVSRWPTVWAGDRTVWAGDRQSEQVTDSLSRWPDSLSRWPTVWAGDRTVWAGDRTVWAGDRQSGLGCDAVPHGLWWYPNGEDSRRVRNLRTNRKNENKWKT